MTNVTSKDIILGGSVLTSESNGVQCIADDEELWHSSKDSANLAACESLTHSNRHINDQPDSQNLPTISQQ